MSVLEGSLQKWTNYVKRWRERYFVVGEDHTLSYYHYKEDIGKERGLVYLRDVKLDSNRKDPMRLSINDGEIVIRFRNVAEKMQWVNSLSRLKEEALRLPPPAIA